MSNEMMRSNPLRLATAAAPTTPPAGPDNTVRTGSRAADLTAVIPPLDCITKILLFRLLECARRARFSKYFCMTGCKYAFTTTVLVRSYSRNSGRISWETEIGTPRDLQA